MLLIVSSFNEAFSALAPDDLNYRVWRSQDESYEHILPAELQHWLSPIEQHTQLLLRHYETSYQHKLDQRASLLWASYNNQVTNAYATQYPLQHTVYYRGAPPAFDSFAITSWWKTLLIHEVAHLYQLNPKKDLSKVGHKIFGNNPITFLPMPFPANGSVSAFPIPVVTTPTMLLPTWMLEGNGVLNESLFGNGGRLYSGETYAVIYRLLANKKVDENRMTNNVLDFPYGTEKYLLGGLINLYMAQKWGTDIVNQFYVAHSTHYFNPFRVNSTFKKHFGMSYAELLNEALNFYRKKAAEQKVEPVRPIVASWSKPWPTRNKDGAILLMAQDQMHKLPVVVTLSSQNGGLVKRQRGAWPIGRAFLIGNNIYSASSALVDRRYVRFSMWGHSERRIKEFDNYWAMDTNGQRWLAANVPESFDELVLYQFEKGTQKKLGISNSSAMIGANGSAVYFKQQGKQRHLMLGEKILFTYTGHWGYPVDIQNEDIYFVAPSSAGAGLFVWRQGQVLRVGKSDAVLGARKLQNGQWLLVQAGIEGYEVGVTQEALSEIPERPFVIQYFFENEKSYQLFESIKGVENDPAQLQTPPTLSKESSYHPFTRMRFTNWNLMYSTASNGTSINTDVHFSDPAAYNELDMRAVLDNPDGEKRATLRYANAYGLLQWGVYGRYDRRTPSRIRTGNETWAAGPLLAYHFWRQDQWDLKGEGVYLAGENNNQSSHGALFDLSLKRKRGTSLGMYPVTNTALSYQSQLFPNGAEDGLFYQGTYHFGDEFFMDLDHSVTRSTTSSLTPGRQIDDIHLIPFDRRTFSGNDMMAYRAGLGFKHPIMAQWYHPWIPVGVHRFSPIFFGNYWNYQNMGPTVAYEYGLGIDLDVLLGHLASTTFQLSFLNRYHVREDTSIIFQYRGAF